MARYTVHLEATAEVRTTVTVEADSIDQAVQRAGQQRDAWAGVLNVREVRAITVADYSQDKVRYHELDEG